MIIDSREIRNFGEPYIIAEIGANHNGDMGLAKKIIDSACDCGADAVKFQSWTTKSINSRADYANNQKYPGSPQKHFGSLKEMVEKYYLREEQHYLLKKYCDDKNITFCSTPFSEGEADLLKKVGVPFFKIASMDINNLRLLKHVAKQGKPIILSTGMASLSEIETAVKAIESQGNKDIALLHCIAIYPPNVNDINLRNINMLQNLYPDYPIGFSDHSVGTAIPIAAVALGACIIEKHFTVDKDLPGWDHDISANPEEMKAIVNDSKTVNAALGCFQRVVSEAEEDKKLKFRRSIVVTRNIKKGECIKESDITFKRPGTHIAPNEAEYVIGRKMAADLMEDDILCWDNLL